MRNVTSKSVKTVILRKFFQMVFVGADRRSLHIYTATIIGASSKQEYHKTDCTEKKNFCSEFASVPNFRMLFDIAIAGNETNAVKYIQHEDITDTPKKGMLSQLPYLRKVWGDSCKVIYNDQGALAGYFPEISDEALAKYSKQKVLYVHEDKPFYGWLLDSKAIPGKLETGIDITNAEVIKEDYTKRDIYAIDVPQEDMPMGMELVNWIRTTIQFKTDIDDKDFNYCIQNPIPRHQSKVESVDEKAEPKTETEPKAEKTELKEETGPKAKKTNPKYEFLCPDFTWYFSPPIKTYIDTHNATVEIKRKQVNPECTDCPCPKRGEVHAKNANDKYHDGIGPVPNKMTVEFDYWCEEKIKSRQKYRFAAKDISLGAEDFDDVSEIMICLDMTDDHSRGNRQYMMGLFISFALGFGIDGTRLARVKQYFPNILGFQADFLWVAFLFTFSLTMLSRPPKVNDWMDVWASRIRKGCLFISCFWFIAVFACAENEFLTANIKEYYTLGVCVSQGFYWAIIVIEILYLCYLKVRHKDRILKGIFGEDIL